MENGALAELFRRELRGVKTELAGLGREVSEVTGTITAAQESHARDIRGAHERIGRTEDDVERVEKGLADTRVELTREIVKASSRPAVVGGATSAGAVIGLVEVIKLLVRQFIPGSS